MIRITPELNEAPRLDSTAVVGRSGLSGEGEEKGGGTGKQREGLNLPIHFCKNHRSSRFVELFLIFNRRRTSTTLCLRLKL